MFNKLINAITFSLNEYYEVDVYSEENIQGFETPCFFIQLLEVHRGYRLDNRHQRVYNFNIRYHSSEGSDTLNTVGDELMQVLEYITIDDLPLRGTGLKYEIQDGILHVFVNYTCNVEYSSDVVDKMEKISGKVGVNFGKD